SYHSCGNPFTLSFTQDTTVKNWIYDCDDIGLNVVRLYVTDVITGAFDYCETFVDIQDNNGENVCDEDDQNGRVVIEGDIYTEYQEEVEGVMVDIGIPDLEEMTNEQGGYAFGAMIPGGSYMVNPSKDDGHLNGISTLDLILIQKHILGFEYLDSPYKLIAADVNNSEDISSLDLIELRKLILGIYEELPNNESWRFVDASFSFTDPFNPWLSDFPEEYEIYDLNQNMDIDFIGVKIGDLNQSVIANFKGENHNERSIDKLSFNIESGEIKAGQTGMINLRSSNYENINGWQGTFEFDPSKLEIIEINSVALEDFEAGNYHISEQEEGWISLSYHGDARSIDDSDIVLEIIVAAKQDLQTDNAIHMSSRVTTAESYTGYGSVQGMSVENIISESQSRIVDVQPNPWVEKASLSFELSKADFVQFKFYDTGGRLIYSDSGNYSAGSNRYSLTKSQIVYKGVIYIQMITSDGVEDYKMIML
ncbi:MAG: hypothetical protein KJO50_04480, partial [Bacteroidia bacterium]|nr:hypothetical protein [Bacteroidia bacterium]